MEKLKKLAKKEIRVAVLPFQVFSSKDTLSPIISGFTEDLIINFSKFLGLSVISQFSTQHITDLSDKEKISDLGADYFITGSFRSVVLDLRISVQLIKALMMSSVYNGWHFLNG